MPCFLFYPLTCVEEQQHPCSQAGFTVSTNVSSLQISCGKQVTEINLPQQRTFIDLSTSCHPEPIFYHKYYLQERQIANIGIFKLFTILNVFTIFKKGCHWRDFWCSHHNTISTCWFCLCNYCHNPPSICKVCTLAFIQYPPC